MIAVKTTNRLTPAEAYPGQPWLWRKDWANGSIRASAQGLVAPLIFAVAWNVFCVVWWLAALFRPTSHPIESTVWWFLVAFSTMGAGMLAWAVVSVMRWRKYGRSIFEMASVPGVIGGKLVGVIRTPIKIAPQDGFRLKLICAHCVSPRRSRGSIVRNVIWQDEQVVAPNVFERDLSCSAIPVSFQIPAACRSTDDSNPNDLVHWGLEVTAKTPGLDYCAVFNVPVFDISQSTPDAVADLSPSH